MNEVKLLAQDKIDAIRAFYEHFKSDIRSIYLTGSVVHPILGKTSDWHDLDILIVLNKPADIIEYTKMYKEYLTNKNII